jgi:transposase
MARMAAKEPRDARARRQFTDEFKAGAVRLVLDEGKTIAEVARDLDLTPSALAGWVKHARADRDGGKTGLTSDEQAELDAASVRRAPAADHMMLHDQHVQPLVDDFFCVGACHLAMATPASWWWLTKPTPA